MKVVLLRLPTLLRMVSLTTKATPTIGLAYVAAALKNAGHQVKVIDTIAENPEQFYVFKEDIVCNGLTTKEIIERIPKDTDVIGLSIMYTNNWLNDRLIIDALGEAFPKAKIIAGGEHVTGVPAICIQHTKHLHACVLGEGEETVVELLQCMQEGKALDTVESIVYRNEKNEAVATPRRTRIREIGNIPWPAWELLPTDIYREKKMSFGMPHNSLSIPIMATRGCPYECTFCSSPNMWGTRYYMRETEDVLNEIKYLMEKFGADNFDFYDLTAIINKRWMVELAQKIVAANLAITWQIPAGTRSEAIDNEVSHWLYKSGCRSITYAPESGSPRILNEIKKRVIIPKMFESIRHSRANNLNVKLNIIIGFPEETHRDVWQTIGFLIKAGWAGVHDVFAAVFIAYTGSVQFERLVKQGKIDPNSDEYYNNIIDADSILTNNFFNENISPNWLRFYRILYFVAFYGTSWLRFPNRFFRLISNIFTQKFETRGAMGLYNLLSRPFKRKVVLHQADNTA